MRWWIRCWKNSSPKAVRIRTQQKCCMGGLLSPWMLDRLPELGISIDNVTQQLEEEGVEKFSNSFDKLMETLETAVQK